MKNTISSGEDKISNILLKNINKKFKLVLLHLFNTIITSMIIPNRWKKVIVRMIPKTVNNKKDPKNYRPISLTSCISRLGERFILLEISKHLSENKIIIKQQSGFRSFRQTKDNILCICQRNLEFLNKKQQNCTIFFDISKAFDKVWQLGLLYKMKEMKFKEIIIVWLFYFFQNRVSVIFINSTFSMSFDIETGVPQGGVLSPVLFSIFINDILKSPTIYKKTEVYSNLFADDLASSCSAKSIKKINLTLNLFLNKIEKWLFKWRLEMNGKKCQYILFGRSTKKDEIKLKLFNDFIPKVAQTKFLGVTLDSRSNFSKCVDEIVNKCTSRLNILKVLGQKSWKLKNDTIKAIYFSLIRSIIDYNSIIYPLLSKLNQRKIDSIQYKALRIVYKQPIKTKTSTLLELAKTTSISDRITELNKRYLNNCIINNNELIVELISKYKNWYPHSRITQYKTFFCNYRDILFK